MLLTNPSHKTKFVQSSKLSQNKNVNGLKTPTWQKQLNVDNKLGCFYCTTEALGIVKHKVDLIDFFKTRDLVCTVKKILVLSLWDQSALILIWPNET